MSYPYDPGQPEQEAIVDSAFRSGNDLICNSNIDWQPITQANFGDVASLGEVGLVAIRIEINGERVIEGQGWKWSDEARRIYGDAARFVPKEYRLTLRGKAFQEHLRGNSQSVPVMLGFLGAHVSPMVNDVTGLVECSTAKLRHIPADTADTKTDTGKKSRKKFPPKNENETILYVRQQRDEIGKGKRPIASLKSLIAEHLEKAESSKEVAAMAKQLQPKRYGWLLNVGQPADK